MALINFYRGLKEKYNQEVHKDGLYFSTDSLEILLNGSSFGGGLKDVAFLEGKLIFSFMNGNKLEVTIDEATQDLPGLFSAIDKKKLDSIPSGEEITEGLNKIGDNNYADTNYISELKTLTDAVRKLDAQLKSSDGTILQLDLAVVKEIQINGSKVTAMSGVVNLPLSSPSADGVLSKEDKTKLDKVLDTGDGTKYLTDDGNYVSLNKNSVGLGNVDNVADLAKPISTATQNALDGKVDKSKGKSLIEDTLISKLEQLDDKATNDAALASKIPLSLKGVANGVATLDGSGKVPSNQLPSFVDDIIDVYATYTKSDIGVLSNIVLYLDADHALQVTGEAGKIYQNIAEGEPSYQFRWTGTIFAQTGASSLIIGEVAGTAYDGAKGKANADNITKIKGTSLSHIKDELPITTSVDKVTINYECFEGEQYGSTGTAHTADIPSATSSNAGVMSAEDKTKLDNSAAKADLEALLQRVQANEEKLVVVLGEEAVDGSIKKALKDAKDYADSKLTWAVLD